MRLDIFMPFYGSFEYFRQAVNSVLAQDNPDFRLIVVDDMYPDTSPGEWLLALNDPRVQYYRNTENLGPSANYRKCVSLAKSDFMTIMGCDDIMLPNYVSRITELQKSFPEASIVQPGVVVIDSSGSVVKPLADRVKAICRPSYKEPRAFSGEQLAQSLLRANWTYFPSLLWRVEALRHHQFRLGLDVVQDLAMILDITLDGGTLVLDPTVAFQYRRHGTSVSSITGYNGAKFEQELAVFGEMSSRSRAMGWNRAARAAEFHLTSRLNAITELPGALRARSAPGIRSLSRHILMPGAKPPAINRPE